ncbi:Down syndrome cell adhesion molecule-like protein Dscam2 [Belonocnema kinseyi]|uniref:Down syndrome cell adhesion molecule-like protein Dscam2 n=1 Tax=Belonocnema kinseyi TaxID=2817044 RepID=UPI00143DE7F7|nr:Down syndrome cell adhesion molecule-like protein Dscam2 [Belonocnema kinseyi]
MERKRASEIDREKGREQERQREIGEKERSRRSEGEIERERDSRSHSVEEASKSNWAAVVHQRYGPEVQSPGGFLGNNVLMRCNVPSFVRDHVTVTSWLQEPSFNIYPSTISDGKYHMLPSGELLIINISRSDVQMTYRCRTHNRLTQETVASNNFGRVQLTGISRMHKPS